jgi:hypothetical protein
MRAEFVKRSLDIFIFGMSPLKPSTLKASKRDLRLGSAINDYTGLEPKERALMDD